MIEALVSGQAARVVYIQGADVDYIDADAPQISKKIPRSEIQHVFYGASDVESVKVKRREDVYDLLLKKYSFDRGLRLVDLILSEDQDSHLKDEAAGALEDIAGMQPVFVTIKNFLFSTANQRLPLNEADTAVVENFPTLKKLFEDLSVAQVHILLFQDALSKAFANNAVTEDDRRAFYSAAVNSGVFRQLVEARRDGQKINSAVLEGYIALKDFPGARSIIQDWTRSFLEKRTKRQLREIEAEQEVYEDDKYVATTALDRTRHELFMAAQAQQRAIITKLKLGDLIAARRFSHQLVSSQLANGGAEYAAKSLSSLASEARKLGQHSIELEWALNATELAPDDGYAYGVVADTYLQLYRLAEAEAAFRRAIEKGEDEFGIVGLARTLRASGRLEDALKAFDEARLRYKDGRRPQYAWSGYCETLRDLGRFEEALSSYEQANKLFEHEAGIRCGKASVLVDLGRLHEAVEVYKATIDDFRDEPVPYCGLAECFKKMGDFDKALAQYEITIAKFPNVSVAICGRADVLRAMGEFSRALECYRDAMNSFPFEPSAFSGYAETYRDMGDFDNAIRAYQTAIERFPLEARTRSAYANVLKSFRQYEMALQAYDRNVKDFPQHIVNRTGRASMLKQLGHYGEAVAAYRAILQDNPQYAYAVNGLAAALVALGQYSEAENLLNRSAPQTETDWVAYHIGGMILLARAQYEDAAKHFEFGLNNVPFFRQRAVFRQALALARMKQLRYHQAAQALGESGEPIEQLMLVHCYCKLNEMVRARMLLQAVNDNLPSAVENFKHELTAQFGLSDSQPKFDEQWLFRQEMEFMLQAA